MKILVFIFGVSIFFFKSIKFINKIEMSYEKFSATAASIDIAKFSLYLANGVENVGFLYVVISNVISILGILNML